MVTPERSSMLRCTERGFRITDGRFIQHLPQWKQLQRLTKKVSIEVSARGVQDEAAKLKKALHAAYPRERIELDRTIPNKMVSFRFAKTT